MNASTSTKIIKYKAVAEGFEKVFKQINSVTKDNNIKLPESLGRSLAEYTNMITNIKNILSKGTESIKDSELKDVERMLQSLDDHTSSFLNKFSSFRLPKEVVKSFSDINTKIIEAQKRLRALSAGAAKFRGYVGKDTQTGQNVLTDKGYKEAFRQKFKKDEKRKLLTLDSGESFNSFDLLWKQAAEIDKINGNLDLFQQNVLKARNYIRELIDSAKTDGGQTFVEKFNEQLKEQHNRVEAEQKNVDKLRKKYESTSGRGSDIGDMDTAYRNYYNASQLYTDALKEESKIIPEVAQSEQQHTFALDKKQKTLMGTVASAYTYHTVLSFIKRTIREAIQVITDMDQALTGMSIVTTMTREETWQLVGSFQSLAKETGKTTTEIASMATKFYQQGKNTKEVLELTEAAAKAATIAGIDGAQSIDLLTNAMNGFQLASTKAMEVSDKFAALAAASATDYEELATALSKVAAQANLAGMSIDFTLGLLAKGIEVTREAPETIGTALKTVIARMRELTDYGKTLEDDMDVNRVAKALDVVGIKLMDQAGQFRDLEEVFTEIGESWDTLNKNQQANIAIAMAGTRQQSRFIAMMQDFDRTIELVNISTNSYGATLAQQAKYMEGMEAKMTLMKNAWEETLISFVNSDLVIGGIEAITNGLEFINENMWLVYTATGALLLLGAKKLIQTEKIKQAEFEINKIQIQQRIAEKQAEIEQSKNFDENLARLEAEQELAEEKQKIELHNQKVAKVQNELILAMKDRTAKKEQQLLQESLLADKKAAKEKIENQKEIYEATLIAKGYSAEDARIEAESKYAQQLAEANQEIYETSQNLYNAITEYKEADSKVLKLDKDLQAVQAKNVEIQEAYNTKLNEAIAIKKKDHELNQKQLSAELMQIQAQYNDYVFSLRNLKGNLTDIIKNIKLIPNKLQNLWTTIKGANWGKIGGQALIALGIAGIVASINYGKKKWDEYTNYIEHSTKQLEQLQVDLYNAQQEYQGIKKLSNEFKELANKISLTTDEAQRFKEIAEEINSSEGRTIIDTSLDRQAQLGQMRGYEYSKKQQQQTIVDNMQESIATGMDRAAYGDNYKTKSTLGAIAGTAGGAGVAAAGAGTLLAGVAGKAAGAVGIKAIGAGRAAKGALAVGAKAALIGGPIIAASVAALAGAIALGTHLVKKENEKRTEEYRNFLTTSSVGQQTLRQVVQQNVEDLQDFTASQQKNLEDIFISMVGDKNNGSLTVDGGLQTDIFEEMLAENKEQLLRFYNADNFTDMWKELSGTTNQFQKYAKSSAGAMGFLANMGEEAALALDKTGVGLDNFMDVINNTSSLMNQFGMSAEDQRKVLTEVSNAIVEGDSIGEQINAVKDAINENLKVSKADYKAAIKQNKDIRSGKYILQGQGGDDLSYEDVKERYDDDVKKGRDLDKAHNADDAAAKKQYEDMIAANDEIIRNYENQEAYKYDLINSINDLLFPVEDANNFADSLTKITSASKRLGEVLNNLDTMSLADKLKLIEEYPTLASDIIKGTLSAENLSQALIKQYNNKLAAFEKAETNISGHMESLIQELDNSQFTYASEDVSYSFDVSKMTGLNESSVKEAQKILNAVEAGMNTADLIELMGGNLSSEEDKSKANDILANAQKLINLSLVKEDYGETYLDFLKEQNKEEPRPSFLEGAWSGGIIRRFRWPWG